MQPTLPALVRIGLRLAVVAALALAAGRAAALSAADARHLLNRTGFGAAPHEIRTLLPLTRMQAVDRVLATLDAEPPLAAPPAFLAEPIGEYLPRLGSDYVPPAMASPSAITSPAANDQALAHHGMQEMEQLRVWWLDRMISTPAPFAERLALFWHGHFTSKYFDVLAPRLMHDQLEVQRALGKRNFAALLHAMLRDPALLIFLDNAINTRTNPNENLARELLELFTLGAGRYGEDDVKALARLLAGHSVDFAGDWRYLVRSDELDPTPRRFLGTDGVRTLADAERVILAHPATARFIADKFTREFVTPEPDARDTERLAQMLRKHRYAMRPFLRALLTSDAFWAPANRAALVKSPVELLVSYERTFGVPLPDLGMLAEDARLLGQDLFEPPSVAGWKQGIAWLNSQSLALRTDRLAALWRCRTAGRDWASSGPDDLLVRFSAEREGAAPMLLRVRVDGVEVATTRPRCAAEAVGAGQGAAKPAWDLLRIPRGAVPARPRSIELAFERTPGAKAFLFVNWVQIDGRRLPAYLGDMRSDADQPCTGQEPTGMMYCPGRLSFDLSAVDRRGQGVVPSLYDRQHGPVNAVIESATVRTELALRPAARTPAQLRADIASEWQKLPLPDAVLGAPPATRLPADPGASEQRLELLLLDPSFNLK